LVISKKSLDESVRLTDRPTLHVHAVPPVGNGTVHGLHADSLEHQQHGDKSKSGHKRHLLIAFSDVSATPNK